MRFTLPKTGIFVAAASLAQSRISQGWSVFISARF
jgi:hypothetical protein